MSTKIPVPWVNLTGLLVSVVQTDSKGLTATSRFRFLKPRNRKTCTLSLVECCVRLRAMQETAGHSLILNDLLGWSINSSHHSLRKTSTSIDKIQCCKLHSTKSDVIAIEEFPRLRLDLKCEIICRLSTLLLSVSHPYFWFGL